MKNKELDSKGFAKSIKKIERLGDLIKNKQEKKSDLLIDFEKTRFLFIKEKISKSNMNFWHNFLQRKCLSFISYFNLPPGFFMDMIN